MSGVLIAVTGGIGAGKSTVAHELKLRGAVIIDGDLLAREVVDPQRHQGRAVLQRIVALLGPDAIDPSGGLARETVARMVFSDPSVRTAYEAIIHPAIREATVTALRAAREGGSRVVAHEIPLLDANTGPLPWSYDLVVTVEAPAAVRVARLMATRGYTREQAEERIRAQGTAEARLAIADVVIRSDGDLASTRRQVGTLWRSLSSPPRAADPDSSLS